ncbi:uncharacterized protein LOC121976466 isoform X1 [Zingiber officinale]|uniref:uncharacterized protein LOC121976466 isoform X1 n=1 Tax=Zingiber officinale TaxID=94328 RepID=UPI001C4D2A7C|nr:uncharacterized protein LOC121976466 isoform X1 [Zingiber officinale]
MAALALPSFKFTFCSRIPSTSQENFTFARSFFSSYLTSPPLRSSPVDRPSAISLRRHRSLPRASSEGIPAELVEDSKFVPLNADDPIYGPPALLLVGFEVDEKEKIQMFLKELDGDFLKVIYCTEDMIEKTVSDAMHTEQVHLDDVKVIHHDSSYPVLISKCILRASRQCSVSMQMFRPKRWSYFVINLRIFYPRLS